MMKKTILFKRMFFSLVLVLAVSCAFAQSADMATTVMRLWPDSLQEKGKPARWTYDQGVVMAGFAGLWKSTGDGRYFRFIQQGMDRYVDSLGNIRTYKKTEYNLDNIRNGCALLLLYKVTGFMKYKLAADQLWEQLREQPRTHSGGFWHKQRYPYQMWLDGLYMAEPFYAEYAATFKDAGAKSSGAYASAAYYDITRQFVLMEQHSRDARTGLLYHGWDESLQQRWADKVTGHSPNFWGRAMGWYGMALVDVLEYFPADHPGRDSLLQILSRYAVAVQKYQDARSGCWYQVLDKAGEKGNYLEASCTAMFVYTLAKGVRLGYLPATYLPIAQKGYKGLQQQFIRKAPEGGINLEGTCSVAGLGGEPYRDGSYAYYLSEKVVTNDPKGIGAYMQAANEIALATKAKTKVTVTLDNYYNNEWKNGTPWHYLWDEQDNSGYSLWGYLFNARGAQTTTLKEKPTAANLANSQIYIITDPDTDKESDKPAYMNAADAEVIYNWVKQGGVLVIMQNDAGNAEISRFNTLTGRFGIHFNEDSRNRVEGKQFDQGALQLPAGNAVFTHGGKVYIKELSTIRVKAPATALFTDKGDIIIATAKLGKGTVFAVGDPWFYNEYLDGRKLPDTFQNYQAAEDLTDWLIKQAKH
jgi:unsaturated rhamnogalacturonyl hydrolase